MNLEAHHRPDSASDGETLFQLLASLARRASDGRLATAAAIGVAGIVAIAIFRPGWWRLALPLTCVAAFGAWGIADRSAGASPARARTMRVVRVLAAVLGLSAALATALVTMAAVLGTWIS